MTQYEIYVFCLCAVVFLLLVSTFSVLLYFLVKQQLKLIRGGLEDETLKIEYRREREKSHKFSLCGCFVSLAISAVFIAFLVFSLIVNLRQDTYFDNIPTAKVVSSGSMSEKHEKNTYLTANGLDDQFQTFDLVWVYKVPAEQDIRQYDIVVYETAGIQIIHRVVNIEEPNDRHPDERYFLCQGDAIETPDRFPVYYKQIKAIYRGERIPFIGSFIKFMQSPAGWLCVALMLFGVFGMPWLEKKFETEMLTRLRLIGYVDTKGAIVDMAEQAVTDEIHL